MKAIILARVSTEEQRDAGNSLPAQIERMEAYCMGAWGLAPLNFNCCGVIILLRGLDEFRTMDWINAVKELRLLGFINEKSYSIAAVASRA